MPTPLSASQFLRLRFLKLWTVKKIGGNFENFYQERMRGLISNVDAEIEENIKFDDLPY